MRYLPDLPSLRSLFRNRRYQVAALIVLAMPVAWLLAHEAAPSNAGLVARVKRGEFKVTVTTSGELKARESVQITAPQAMQQVQVYQTRISTIVPEGTEVKAGDVVAELDRSQVASKMSEVSLALQKAEAVYEQAMLDSALNLSKAREDIKTMEFGLEEKRLAKEQSVYEPPTITRQAEIDYEKAQRALAQAKQDYETKVEQAKAKMREVGADRERQRNQLANIQKVMEGFTVRAPAAGMVIYDREWNGRKRTTGSQVSAWDNTVATLPDLTRMESVTYVNEIDVRKIAVGQPAVLTLDSDPTKRLTGKVTQVANVGEQRPNTDAKVFEVHVVIDQADTTLRPGMTTGNQIETARIDTALYVPLEALNSEAGVPFVYKQSGSGARKQEVATGAMNDDEVVILRGLEEDDRVLLTPPPDHDKVNLVRLPATPAPPAAPATSVAGGDTALRASPQPDTSSKKSR